MYLYAALPTDLFGQGSCLKVSLAIGTKGNLPPNAIAKYAPSKLDVWLGVIQHPPLGIFSSPST